MTTVKRQAALVLLGAMLALLAVPSAQAERETEQVLAGQVVPLTVTLRELTPEWRRVTIGGAADASGGGMMGFFAMMFGGGGPAAPNAYYTRGQTVSLAPGEVFLVAYRAPSPQPDMAAMMRQGPGATPPAPEPLTPETQLSLALLNMRTITSLGDIRPFELQREIEESQRAAEQFGELLRQQGRPTEDEPSKLLGQPAPEVQAPDITGRERSLNEFRGRVVLLNFFASW